LVTNQKIALVTGAGSGIGRAAAVAFAAAGAAVAVIDINDKSAAKTLDLIQTAGGTSIAVRTDVSAESDVAAMIATILDRYGRLDWAFNNAGIADQPGFDVPVEMYQQIMDVNVKGTWLCMKHEIAAMRRTGGGSIVNTSSVAGITGSRETIYSASKHAVIGLTRSGAMIHGRDHIRVNAICPGMVDGTGGARHVVDAIVASSGDSEEAISRQRAASSPLGRTGTPEDIAQAALWLCSEQASYVTGHVMLVEGGLTLVHPHTMAALQ
jgi:NAD(P)-dependent dehydrogenase (short-subunit alcohol dehydrogenase family)